jgi:hypothetical protein
MTSLILPQIMNPPVALADGGSATVFEDLSMPTKEEQAAAKSSEVRTTPVLHGKRLRLPNSSWHDRQPLFFDSSRQDRVVV